MTDEGGMVYPVDIKGYRKPVKGCMSVAEIVDSQRRVHEIERLQGKLEALKTKSNLDSYTDHTQTSSSRDGGITTMATHRLRVCVGYNDDGSPVVKQISARSEIELADKAAKAVLASERRREFVGYETQTKEEQQPTDEKPKVPTFGAYAATWYRTYKCPKLKPNTLAMYQDCIGRLSKAFEDTPMNEITTATIQETLNGFATHGRKGGKPLAKSSVEHLMLTARQVFRSAFEDGVISKNPTDTKRITNTSNVVNEREALTDAEYFDILKNLPKLKPEDQALIGLFALTGMRRGEVCGLRWENVDFDQELIHVRDNATYPNNANDALLGTPKSRASVRDLGITPQIRQILEALPRSGVFVIGRGDEPITKSSYRKRFDRIKQTIDLHGATAHIFRHTYGTYLSYWGVGAVDLTAIMGHEDVSTTMKYYVHVKMDSVRNAEQEAAKSIERGIEEANRAA